MELDGALTAVISLEPFGDPEADQLVRAGAVEGLWAAGRHDQAIRELEALEASGAALAVMIAWREPVAVAQPKYYPDALISNRTGGQILALDHHPGSGNIFALVVWEHGWTLHMSADYGISWSETHFWTTTTISSRATRPTSSGSICRASAPTEWPTSTRSVI